MYDLQFWASRDISQTKSDSTRQCSKFSGIVWTSRTISDGKFQPDVRSLFWPYFANRVSIWSHSSSASFVTLWGWSFLSCWLVFLITFFQGSLFGVLNVGHRLNSCEKFWLGSRSPRPLPLWSPPRSFKLVPKVPFHISSKCPRSGPLCSVHHTENFRELCRAPQG
jgi:hypothetical protein